MIEIFIYYVWIALCLYAIYVLQFRTYVNVGNSYEKKRFPLFAPILAVLTSVIPLVNIVAFVVLATYMYILYNEERAEFRAFLFKNV